MQRCSVFIGAYDYDIYYKISSKHGNAAGHSQCPISSPEKEIDSEVHKIQHELCKHAPVDFEKLLKPQMMITDSSRSFNLLVKSGLISWKLKVYRLTFIGEMNFL